MSMTRTEVRAKVIAYFAWRFGAPASEFTNDTKVRRRFSAAAWAGLADVFNNTTWMEDLGVKLKRSDMKDLKTIGGLVDAIAKKASI